MPYAGDHQNVHFLYGKMICATQYTNLSNGGPGGKKGAAKWT